MKKKITFWDIILWIGILMILVWALLKVFGGIHSPMWVEMVPYFGAVASAVGGAYKLGKIMQGVEHTNKKVEKLIEMKDRFNKIEHEHNLYKEGKLKFHKE